VNQQSQVNWEAIRQRGELFPAEALDFVRDGLAHTVEILERRPPSSKPDDRSRHVTGRELCEGLRDMAVQRYGMLARTVLRKWGILRTEDFGAIVYTLIDRGELRSSEDDSLDHFRAVYDFDEAFREG
jgi:uncharacterized repeat protein (TIGR04138 family)